MIHASCPDCFSEDKLRLIMELTDCFIMLQCDTCKRVWTRKKQ